MSDDDQVNKITATRGPVYGPFKRNALVAQSIKNAMRMNFDDRASPHPITEDEKSNFPFVPADVREALDLIAVKIARIVTGDPEYLDNWDDIGGYAKIVADRIRKDKTQSTYRTIYTSKPSPKMTFFGKPVKADDKLARTDGEESGRVVVLKAGVEVHNAPDFPFKVYDIRYDIFVYFKYIADANIYADALDRARSGPA